MRVEWNKEQIRDFFHENEIEHFVHTFARIEPPRGMVKNLKPLGKLRGHCFERCLQIAHACPDKFYYCEGYADGHPHAWLCLKTVSGKKNDRNVVEVADEDWALDPTWIWKSPKYHNYRPIDDIMYVGLKCDAQKLVNWLLSQKGSSCSFLRNINRITKDSILDICK